MVSTVLDLISAFKHDVAKPTECMTFLINALTQGTIKDEFQKNPLKVISCVLATLAFVSSQFVKDDSPDVIGTDSEEVESAIQLSVLANKLGIDMPAEGGFISSWVLKMIIAKLMELLAELAEGNPDDVK